jgi:ATP-binding protein involved in chromosome partitioning
MDSGLRQPTVVAEPESKNTERYKDISRCMAAKLAGQGKDYSTKFPNIVIQNT